MSLLLRLSVLPTEAVRGIYGLHKNALPERMRFLYPAAAASYLQHLADRVVVSDMFRSAEASLLAVRTRAGSQPPAFSAHNYGLAIDLDIDRTRRAVGAQTKKSLDHWMAERGWFCHRRDSRDAMEAWHYNFEVDSLIGSGERTTAPAVERKIQLLYGSAFQLDARGVQRALKQLGLYAGEVDGDIGPLSRTAISAFQRAWSLRVDGDAGTMTKRTLAYVTASRQVVAPGE
jgi:hypothetical protein